MRASARERLKKSYVGDKKRVARWGRKMVYYVSRIRGERRISAIPKLTETKIKTSGD